MLGLGQPGIPGALQGAAGRVQLPSAKEGVRPDQAHVTGSRADGNSAPQLRTGPRKPQTPTAHGGAPTMIKEQKREFQSLERSGGGTLGKGLGWGLGGLWKD